MSCLRVVVAPKNFHNSSNPLEGAMFDFNLLLCDDYDRRQARDVQIKGVNVERRKSVSSSGNKSRRIAIITKVF